MKIRLAFLICLLLGACTPAPVAAPSPTPVFTCETPGTVQNLTLDNASRGYPYAYSLYLPPCYERDTGRVYPVLYLVPGRGSGPRTWFGAGAGQVADELIMGGQVAPFLIVATETINSDMYAKTILEELVPYIEAEYRVSPERQHHAVAGGSLGGIAAYRIALRFPDQFASAGIFGAGVISGEEEQVRSWLADIPEAQMPRVFLNTGEGDPLMLERARAMLSILDEQDVQHTEIFTDGDHSYGYWVSNLPDYFRWMAQDW